MITKTVLLHHHRSGFVCLAALATTLMLLAGLLGACNLAQKGENSPPTATVKADIACRSGPTSEHSILDTQKAGEVLNIQGRSRSGDAWVVLDPDLQDTCWVGGMWVDVTGAVGQVQIIDPDPPMLPRQRSRWIPPAAPARRANMPSLIP